MLTRLPAAVVFDIDGLLVESEQYWDEARRAFVAEHGGGWTSDDQRRVMGANSREWARYISEHFRIALPPEQIVGDVQTRVLRLFRDRVPVLPGALETVRALVDNYSLGVASSGPRPVIEAVLDHLGLRAAFAAVAPADEVAHEKPAPDVSLEVVQRLEVNPADVVAVEDSVNGAAAASAARMKVIAVPNRQCADRLGFQRADLIRAHCWSSARRCCRPCSTRGTDSRRSARSCRRPDASSRRATAAAISSRQERWATSYARSSAPAPPAGASNLALTRIQDAKALLDDLTRICHVGVLLQLEKTIPNGGM
jgi:HAD superfamily hydrolase (TIGR01509 family)